MIRIDIWQTSAGSRDKRLGTVTLQQTSGSGDGICSYEVAATVGGETLTGRVLDFRIERGTYELAAVALAACGFGRERKAVPVG